MRRHHSALHSKSLIGSSSLHFFSHNSTHMMRCLFVFLFIIHINTSTNFDIIDFELLATPTHLDKLLIRILVASKSQPSVS